jgi:hypothetical protein
MTNPQLYASESESLTFLLTSRKKYHRAFEGYSLPPAREYSSFSCGSPSDGRTKVVSASKWYCIGRS